MIIFAQIIHKPRRSRQCAACGKKMIAGVPQMRLYGGDDKPPYTIYCHVECAGNDPKVRRVRQEAQTA